MQSRTTTFLAVISLAIPGALNAQPATKNVFTVTPNLTTPIGIAYSPFVNKLLVTQPFCGTISGTKATGFQVVQVDPAGASSLFAILPDVPLSTDAGSFHTGSPYNQCFENYIGVSPGLGGFPANQVYVTQGKNVVTIPPGGGTATQFAGPLGTEDTESGISFDTVGTFCSDIIVSGANGLIYLINSTGTATLYATVSSMIGLLPGAVASETSTVAPLTFQPYPGWLLIGIENSTAGPGVAAIQPPSACSSTGIPTIPNSGSPTQVRISNQPSPEAVLSVPASATSCQFGKGSSAGSFFSITYTAGITIPSLHNPYQIVSYSASDFTGLTGDVMVVNEGQTVDHSTSPATNYLIPGGSGPTVASALFDAGTSLPSFLQQEGATFVGCPIPPTIGCVLTPGGYKNHFNYKVTPLTIGGQAYTAAEVTTIVSTGGGGIVALGRSLATALLNTQYGAVAPPSVLTAISQAQVAIFNVTTAVGKTIFQASLSTSIADPLNNILDAFNNGSAGQQECTQ